MSYLRGRSRRRAALLAQDGKAPPEECEQCLELPLYSDLRTCAGRSALLAHHGEGSRFVFHLISPDAKCSGGLLHLTFNPDRLAIIAGGIIEQLSDGRGGGTACEY